MKIFAHRGASKKAPENTLAAVSLALELPIAGVEIDLFSKGKEYLVMHDRWLTRTTGLSKRLDQVTYRDLRTISLGQFEGIEQKIPILSEVLALNWQHTILNIELKQIDNIEHFLAYLDNCLSTLNLCKSQIMLSSFNHHYLSAIRCVTEQYALGWLTASNLTALAKIAAAEGCQIISVDLDVIEPRLIKDAHQRGLELFVYTVDEIDDMRRLADWGVDGIFTNVPDLAHQFLTTSEV